MDAGAARRYAHMGFMMMRTRMKTLVPLVAVLALGGCAYQTEAQINAELSRHIGQSAADLVRDMGVPNRSIETAGGHRFMAYLTGHQEIYNWGGGYGYGYGGWGGWGWGGPGWGPGWGGWGGGWGPSDVVNYGCQTTFELVGGRVTGFTRHGNAC
jgi:hypothetical protein